MKTLRIITGLSCLVVLLWVTAAFAAYPDRPITLINVFSAGGSTDIAGRILARHMEKRLGQPVVVQNIVGGAGTAGLGHALASKPDGYTLSFVPWGVLTTQPHLIKVPYALDSMEFIGQAINQPQVLLTSNKASWKNFEEMITKLRANPNKYICGITGIGNLTHLPYLAFSKKYNVKIRVLPFINSTELCKEMLANRVHLYFCEPSFGPQFGFMPYLQTSHEKIETMEGLPSFKDIGIPLSISVRVVLLAPRGLPIDVKTILEKTMEDVVKEPEFIAEIERSKLNVAWMSADETLATYNTDLNMYGDMINEAGLKKKK